MNKGLSTPCMSMRSIRIYFDHHVDRASRFYVSPNLRQDDTCVDDRKVLTPAATDTYRHTQPVLCVFGSLYVHCTEIEYFQDPHLPFHYTRNIQPASNMKRVFN